MEKSHVGMFNCYFCNEPAGILLDRRLRNSLPQNVGVIDTNPCQKCRGYMDQGIILISIRDDTTEAQMRGEEYEYKDRWGWSQTGHHPPNPYRTGAWCVVKQEAFERMVTDPAMRKFGVTKRFMFITDSAWDAVGLPRGEEVKPCQE